MTDKVLDKGIENTGRESELPKLWPMWGIIMLSLIGLLIAYPGLPDSLPIHFNYRWEADDMAHKSVLFPQGLLPVLFLAVMEYRLKGKKRKDMTDKQKKSYRIIEILLSSLFILMTWLPLISVWNEGFRLSRSLPLIMGFYLVILGNYMPTIRQNRYLGVRAPWIRNDKRVWKKAQKAGGFLLVLLGVLLIISGITSDLLMYQVTAGVMAAGIVILYGYTLVLSKKLKTQK